MTIKGGGAATRVINFFFPEWMVIKHGIPLGPTLLTVYWYGRGTRDAAMWPTGE